MSEEAQAGTLRARVTIRKGKAIVALKKISEIIKSAELSDAATALDLLPIDKIAEFLQPCTPIAKDLMFFNHHQLDFSDEKIDKAAEQLSLVFKEFVDVYRAFTALLVYSEMTYPSPIQVIPPATGDDYKSKEAMMERYSRLFTRLRGMAESHLPDLPLAVEDETPDCPNDVVTQTTD